MPALRALELLPPAIGPRSFARGRALTLRERGFPHDAIARGLDSEGYIAPDRALGEWTRSDVNRLLREARAFAKQAATASDKEYSPVLRWLRMLVMCMSEKKRWCWSRRPCSPRGSTG